MKERRYEMTDLEKLKKDVLDYCERVKAKGGEVAEYVSPCCQSTLMSNVPGKKGEVWDSLVVCYECGERHFVVKKIDGIVASKF